MRFLKYIIPFLFIALFLSFCEFPRKVLVRTVENSELIGKWNQMNTDEIVGDNDINIKSIQLVNDSIAKISFIDSTGARLVMGKWVNGYKKELKNNAGSIAKVGDYPKILDNLNRKKSIFLTPLN